MKKFIGIVATILALSIAHDAAARDTYVQGYTRKDGTHVQGHYRSAPNNSVYDNYSTKGNVNPYTGKAGTIDPYSSSNGNEYNNNNNNYRSNSGSSYRSWND